MIDSPCTTKINSDQNYKIVTRTVQCKWYQPKVTEAVPK